MVYFQVCETRKYSKCWHTISEQYHDYSTCCLLVLIHTNFLFAGNDPHICNKHLHASATKSRADNNTNFNTQKIYIRTIMRTDVRMCKETCSACVTVKSWDCRFSREPIYNKSWDLHARHNHNITSCAKTTLHFRCYRGKQQWLGCFRFNLLSCWRPLTSTWWDWYQVTLQGDIHFSISSLSNAAVNLHLDQPSKLTHSVRGSVRTGLYNSVEKLCIVAVIPFGKRHGQSFFSCDSWRQILGNSIIWKKLTRGLPLQALVRGF